MLADVDKARAARAAAPLGDRGGSAQLDASDASAIAAQDDRLVAVVAHRLLVVDDVGTGSSRAARRRIGAGDEGARAGPPDRVQPGCRPRLLDAGAWEGVGVLGPEAFPAAPFLELLADYGAPHGIDER